VQALFAFPKDRTNFINFMGGDQAFAQLNTALRQHIETNKAGGTSIDKLSTDYFTTAITPKCQALYPNSTGYYSTNCCADSDKGVFLDSTIAMLYDAQGNHANISANIPGHTRRSNLGKIENNTHTLCPSAVINAACSGTGEAISKNFAECSRQSCIAAGYNTGFDKYQYCRVTNDDCPQKCANVPLEPAVHASSPGSPPTDQQNVYGIYFYGFIFLMLLALVIICGLASVAISRS
jgi:hypothetical protein